MPSVANLETWGVFTAGVVALLLLDLFVFHRKPHAVGMREALFWSVIWILLAMAFNAFVYIRFGPQRGLEFLTGYLIEKALAVDNLFVFTVIFSYFGIQQQYQHRVLFWGVIGALVFRALFIALGATLLAYFHWVAYLFGAFLALTGVQLIRAKQQLDPQTNPVFRAVRKVLPTTKVQSGDFLVRHNSQLLATPLLLSLILVEISDIIFAVDSIPAIFAVTSDPFIVFTSNVFAVLGLRALYSLLAQSVMRLKYLRFGLAMVLIFVGAKMLVAPFYKVPVVLSLGVVLVLLLGAALASLSSRASSEAKVAS